VKGSRSTQRGRILELLIAARGDWVPLPKITECAAQYNARIHQLRRLGFRIENHSKQIDGVRHSSFRLVRGPDQSARGPQPDRIAKAREWLSVARGTDTRPEPLPTAACKTGTLFPMTDPHVYHDPEEGWR
jgi:hypothetical protein